MFAWLLTVVNGKTCTGSGFSLFPIPTKKAENICMQNSVQWKQLPPRWVFNEADTAIYILIIMGFCNVFGGESALLRIEKVWDPFMKRQKVLVR